MMKSRSNSSKMILTAIASFVLVVTSMAQVKPYDFPKIKPADFSIPPDKKDSNAVAIVLGDKGESSFEYSEIKGFQLVFTRHLRIRILAKAGYKFATNYIPLYRENGSAESLTQLKGFTYNLEDGKVEDDKLGNSNIFEELVNNNRKLIKYTMPNIKVGSIIDIQYSILSDYIWNLQEWEFQSSIPVQWSEYTVTIPEYFIFSKLTHGSVPFTISEMTTIPGSVNFVTRENSVPFDAGLTTADRSVNTTYEHHQVNFIQNICHFATSNVPALIEEPYAPAMTNFISKVEFELHYTQLPGSNRKDYTNTWQDICDILLRSGDFGDQLQKGRIVKDAVGEINAIATTPIDKMNAAHRFIRSRMTWNGHTGLYPTSTLSKAYDEQSGNDSDINLLLLLLLKELGLETSPVVLSTRSNGILVESHPVLFQLNYVLASVTIDGKTYLLDATGKHRPPGFLPRHCLNGSGLLISREGYQWIPLLGEERDNMLYQAEMKIDSEGSVSGVLKVSNSGYSAEEVRIEYSRDGAEKYFADLKEKYKDWKVGEITVENIDSIGASVNVHYTLSSEEVAQRNGNLIYVNALLGFGVKINPFKAERRENVVDFIYPIKNNYVFSFEIPEGFTVESMPEPIKMILPDQAGSFRFFSRTTGHTVNFNSVVNITKTNFTADEYEGLREFFTRIVAKHAQQVVLKKS